MLRFIKSMIPTESNVNLGFSCDRCRVRGISGVRWNCQECFDYDMCNTCYKQGHHSLTHKFYKISKHGEKEAVKPRMDKAEAEMGNFCDGCMADNKQVRWHCSVCYDYDLCTKCYNRGEHVMSHPFEKITPSTRTLEPPRIQCRSAGAAGMIEELCLDEIEDTPALELKVLLTSDNEYCYVESLLKVSRTSHVVKGTLFSPRYHILQIQRVKNLLLWRKYRNCRIIIMKENQGEANELHLFHGSPNIDNIIKDGFDERRGKGMFGYGTYFAKNSSKSSLYVFGANTGCPKHHDMFCEVCTRKMLLCNVSMGKCYVAPKAKDFPHPPVGFNSVMGKGGHTEGLKHDEYVIYRGEQLRIKSSSLHGEIIKIQNIVLKFMHKTIDGHRKYYSVNLP